eukprot:XP_001704095.1 Hypothetical protein GL50803_37061 [Giardia lamblia ATCC 50803]
MPRLSAMAFCVPYSVEVSSGCPNMPQESTCTWLDRPAFLTRCCMTPCAMGERHMFPRHTKRIFMVCLGGKGKYHTKM